MPGDAAQNTQITVGGVPFGAETEVDEAMMDFIVDFCSCAGMSGTI